MLGPAIACPRAGLDDGWRRLPWDEVDLTGNLQFDLVRNFDLDRLVIIIWLGRFVVGFLGWGQGFDLVLGDRGGLGTLDEPSGAQGRDLSQGARLLRRLFDPAFGANGW